jgi:L-ribulose-5-phosphate 3-epimerase
LSGTTELLHTDRDFVVATLKEQNLRLGIENHPEKNPEEMLAQIGDTADGHIGTTIDTGWYATQSYDVPTAIEKLFPHIFHVHLKDVLPPGDNLSHINCGHGKGIVPIEACVRTLHRLGYTGDYSNENHCLDHDPREELRLALPTVRSYLD